MSRTRADSLAQSDLAHALRDRDKHRVHDADAADKQRYRRDGYEEIFEHVGHAGEYAERRLRTADGKIQLLIFLDVVPFAQKSLHIGDGALDILYSIHLAAREIKILDAEKQLLRRRERHVGHRIGIGEHTRSPLFQDADHLERNRAERHGLADRITIRKQLLGARRTEDDHAGEVALLFGKEESAGGDADILHRHHLR